MTHLNHAGASLVPEPVLETVVGYLREEAIVGGYELASRSVDAIEATYAATAHLVGARPDEIAMVDSATRAWAIALGSIPLTDGDRVLVSRVEYASSMMALLQLAERIDISIEVVPDDDHGQLDVDALVRMLDERVRLVAVTHVPTNSGLVNPVTRIGEALRDSDAVYLLDACQSVGQLPIDVGEIGCHLLTATGRKFLRGPRGTGFLYARTDTSAQLHPPTVDLRSAEWRSIDHFELAPGARRFEMWERNVATLLGLGAAVDYAMDWGIDAVATRIQVLADALRVRLASLDGVEIHDPGKERCGIVTFTVEGIDAASVVERLRDQNINVWHSGRSSARLDFEARGLDSVVRASVHSYNTDEELDQLIDAVRSLR